MKLFNQITSILVAILLVYAMNYKSIVTINFFSNQIELTELFCINKEKPELQCNGKCYLTNQLVEVDKELSNSPFTPNSSFSNLELNLTLFENDLTIQPVTRDLIKPTFFTYSTTLYDGYLSIIPPPPKV